MPHHAILGAGGVGGFVGAILGAAGHRVTLVLRPGSLAPHPDMLTLESPLGSAQCRVTWATRLAEPADVLWVTVKAPQLDTAIATVEPQLPATVVPLLNGIDHVAVLRARFGDRVVPGTIAGETERVAPGRIVHRSRLARLAFLESGQEPLASALAAFTAFGCACALVPDEATLLWSKLVILAPFALATTARAGTIGDVRADPTWLARLEACAREACTVALGSGARVDAAAVLKTLGALEPGMRSSMAKDVVARRPPELEAIAGPILRGGQRLGIGTPITASLAAMVAKIAPK